MHFKSLLPCHTILLLCKRKCMPSTHCLFLAGLDLSVTHPKLCTAKWIFKESILFLHLATPFKYLKHWTTFLWTLNHLVILFSVFRAEGRAQVVIQWAKSPLGIPMSCIRGLELRVSSVIWFQLPVMVHSGKKLGWLRDLAASHPYRRLW